MKKLVLASMLSVGLFTVQSCKKENTTSDLTAASSSHAEDPSIAQGAAAAPHSSTQEEFIKEAQSKPLTSLALSENHFNFGDVKKGESVEHVYEVTNTGENPLIISNVRPGCGCTAPEFTKDPILPGQKGKITLRFDSSSFDGAQHKQAEVYANVEQTPIVITFTANVKS